MEELLLAADEVLQEVDGVALVRGEESVALNGQEVVPTVGISGAGDTYTSRFELYLAAKAVAVMRGRAASLRSSTIAVLVLIIVTALGRKEISARGGENLPQKDLCARQKNLGARLRNNLGALTAAAADLPAKVRDPDPGAGGLGLTVADGDGADGAEDNLSALKMEALLFDAFSLGGAQLKELDVTLGVVGHPDFLPPILVKV